MEEEKIEEIIDDVIEEKVKEKLGEQYGNNAVGNPKYGQLSRRGFLKALGVGAGGLALSSSVTGASLLSGTTVDGYTVWHAGNDGSGSGLSADDVDGYHFNVGSSKPGSPFTDAIFFKTDQGGTHYYNGSEWIQISSFAPIVIDDFEDQDLSEWSTSNYSITSSPVHEGSYAAQTTDQWDGLVNSNYTWERGSDPLVYYMHVSGATTGDITTAFAGTVEGSSDYYELVLRYDGTWVLREMSGGSVSKDSGVAAEFRQDDWAKVTIDFDSDGSGDITATIKYLSDNTSYSTTLSSTAYDTGDWELCYPWSSFDGTLTVDYVTEQPS